jgi:hypothetical protein
MKKTMKTLIVLGASIVLLGSQVCFAGSGNGPNARTRTSNFQYKSPASNGANTGSQTRKTDRTQTWSSTGSAKQQQKGK